jgi:LuxR family transcriptional regulator, maltose regulon positive regulatory protein
LGPRAGLFAGDELSYLREFQHITLARVLMARSETSKPRQVAELLERLLHAAEAGERTGSVIEILVLQALTRYARGDLSGALGSLERALALAEPEGYVGVFASEGPPMASLLKQVVQRCPAWDHARRLLDACGEGRETAAAARTTPARQRLIEPLSERELDVLRLLASDLGGPEIARELSVSLNTLRTHTKNIYAKLGVNSRRTAVRQAEELDLLSRTRDR